MNQLLLTGTIGRLCLIAKMKNVIFIGVILIFAVGLLYPVSAGFAVGFPNSIDLNPGETKDISFSLQNIIEPKTDVTIKIVVESGSEYLTLVGGDSFDLSAGEVKSVPARVKAPSDAKALDVFNMVVLFESVSGNGQTGGTVDVSFSQRVSFDIVINEDAQGQNNVWLWVGLFLVFIIAAIIFLALKTRKKSNENPGVVEH